MNVQIYVYISNKVKILFNFINAINLNIKINLIIISESEQNILFWLVDQTWGSMIVTVLAFKRIERGPFQGTWSSDLVYKCVRFQLSDITLLLMLCVLVSR